MWRHEFRGIYEVFKQILLPSFTLKMKAAHLWQTTRRHTQVKSNFLDSAVKIPNVPCSIAAGTSKWRLGFAVVKQVECHMV